MGSDEVKLPFVSLIEKRRAKLDHNHQPTTEQGDVELLNDSRHVITVDTPYVVNELYPGDRLVIRGGGKFKIRDARRFWGKLLRFEGVFYRRA